jgi:hypothetical protein
MKIASNDNELLHGFLTLGNSTSNGIVSSLEYLELYHSGFLIKYIFFLQIGLYIVLHIKLELDS